MGWWPCGACDQVCGPCDPSAGSSLSLGIPSISSVNAPCTTANCNSIFQGTHTLDFHSEVTTDPEECNYRVDLTASCLSIDPLTVELQFYSLGGFLRIKINFYDGATLKLSISPSNATISPLPGAVPDDCTTTYSVTVATGGSPGYVDITGGGGSNCRWNDGKVFTVN